MKNHPDFEKLAHVIQHGLLGFEVKDMEVESTEAFDVSHILKKCVCSVNNFNV